MTRSAPAACPPQESRVEDGQPKTSGSAPYRGKRTGPWAGRRRRTPEGHPSRTAVRSPFGGRRPRTSITFLREVKGAMAVDDLDDIAARGSYRSNPAPVEGAGRLTRRPESRRHSSTSSGGAARTSRDFVETVRSAMAVDDSADLRREEAAVLSPAPTEPHPVAPVSYNVQRFATRRQARTSFSHAPRDSPTTRSPSSAP
jgi:hypothetical protein